VAAVLAFHLGRLGGGFIGVDVFFVVSGFLITRLLLAERERNGAISLGAFWGRRFRRLLPALMLVLVAVAVASRLWLPAWRLPEIRNDALAALTYVANWRFIASGQSYFAQGLAPSPLRHTWSLAIEEQFYLVWPLVVVGAMALARKRFRLAVLVIATVGGLASAAWMAVGAGNGVDLTRLYYGTGSRAFALLAGAWVAAWWDPVVADAPRPANDPTRARPLTRAASVALLPLAVLAVVGSEDSTWFYRGGFQAVAVASAIAVAGLATSEGRTAALLGTPVLRWVGRRSYGIYLWSWPIQVFAIEQFGLDGLALDATVVALSVAAATLSFRFVEEPIRTRWAIGGAGRVHGAEGHARPPRPLNLALRSSAVAIGVTALIVGCAAGAPAAPSYVKVSDSDAVASALSAKSSFGPDSGSDRRTGGAPRSDVRNASNATTTTSTAPGPTVTSPPLPPGPFDSASPLLVDPGAKGDPSGVRGRPLQVMIAGDSVGWSLGWRPSSDLTRAIQIEDRAIIGCGLMPPDSAFIIGEAAPETYGTLCQDQAEAERIGLESGPDVVLLWVGAWEVYDHEVAGVTLRVGSKAYSSILDARIQARIDQYREAGVPTVISKLPCFGENAARLGTERYDRSRIDWVNTRLEEVAARNRGWVHLIDPDGTLCSADGKALGAIPGGHPLRADGAHFDQESAAWFWNDWLAGQLAASFDGGA